MAYEHIAPQHVKTKVFEIGDIKVGGDEPFVLIAGPCQIEGMDHARLLAGDQRAAAAGAVNQDRRGTEIEIGSFGLGAVGGVRKTRAQATV